VNPPEEDIRPFVHGGHRIEVIVETEEGQIFARAECPVCGCSEDSADNDLGSDHAVLITQGKIKAHMARDHKIPVKDPSSFFNVHLSYSNGMKASFLVESLEGLLVHDAWMYPAIAYEGLPLEGANISIPTPAPNAVPPEGVKPYEAGSVVVWRTS
jgi:hypothetical protein